MVVEGNYLKGTEIECVADLVANKSHLRTGYEGAVCLKRGQLQEHPGLEDVFANDNR